MPPARGPGTLCVDYDECQAHECARTVLECLRRNGTLEGCGVATALPPGINALRTWHPTLAVKKPANTNSSNSNTSADANASSTAPADSALPDQGTEEPQEAYTPGYFGIFVALTPCDGNATCWNSLGSYQCICNQGYQRTNASATCQGAKRALRCFQ